MRSILSQDEAEKKRKKYSRAIGIIMLALLVLSTLGYALFYSDRDSTQPGDPNSNTYLLSYPPESLSDIPLNISMSLNNYAGKNVYVSADNSQILNELARGLGKHAARIQQACYGACEENLPEKTCADLLIIWKDSPTPKVTQKENCIFIDGDLRAVDAFLYKILGY